VSLNDCRLIDLPKIADWRGNLTFIEGTRHIPFEIKRVFYLYDVPGGETRAVGPTTQHGTGGRPRGDGQREPHDAQGPERNLPEKAGARQGFTPFGGTQRAFV